MDGMDVEGAVLVFLALLLLGRGVVGARRGRTLAMLSGRPSGTGRSGRQTRGWPAALRGPWGIGAASSLVGLSGTVLGLRIAGPPGALVVGGGAAWVLPLAMRRRARIRRASLERQLVEMTEGLALALRSGMSIPQAMEHAAVDTEPPLTELLSTFHSRVRLGVPFARALEDFRDAVGTEDARLVALVLGMHAKSGGDLASAIDEVLSTMRHRISVRRELRGLTAQGRLSGAILGAVPIGFFLFLAATAPRDLGFVYRSAAGFAMVSGGLVLEGLAYLWIRRLLRIEV